MKGIEIIKTKLFEAFRIDVKVGHDGDVDVNSESDSTADLIEVKDDEEILKILLNKTWKDEKGCFYLQKVYFENNGAPNAFSKKEAEV